MRAMTSVPPPGLCGARLREQRGHQDSGGSQREPRLVGPVGPVGPVG
jgi:hypothetical protein